MSPETVEFESTSSRQHDYDYKIGIDEAFVKRAQIAHQLCERLAQQEGVRLFDLEGAFPLSSSILSDLLLYVDQVMESDDDNARAMALLVAEALHEHPRGFDYLYLHSKVFYLSKTFNLNTRQPFKSFREQRKYQFLTAASRYFSLTPINSTFHTNSSCGNFKNASTTRGSNWRTLWRVISAIVSVTNHAFL